MSELEDLIRQKKEIEAKIQALKAEEYVRHGCVKFEKRDLKGCDHPWQVSSLSSYMSRDWNSKNKEQTEKLRWWPFIRTKTRDEAISIIPTVIKDLSKMYEELIKNMEAANNE